MPTRILRSSILFLTLISTLVPFALSQDETFTRFQKSFKGIRTLQASFEQEVTNAAGTESASGTLWMSRPDRMRWDYSRPERKVFLLEKGKYRFYVPEDRQLMEQSLDSDELEATPLAFLLGRSGDLAAYYRIQRAGEEKGRARYVLTPRNRQGSFVRIVMLLDTASALPSELLLQEENGSRHRYRFWDVQVNRPLPGGIFRFTPPPGTEILRQP